MHRPSEVTRLLSAWSGGRSEALNELLPLIYDELHRLAHRQRLDNAAYETLNTTALVHEAYLRLAGREDVSWDDRHHFFRVAAKAMRNILVDHARAQRAQKRGGAAAKVDANEVPLLSDERAEEVLALDEALTVLSDLDDRQGQIVELRYFTGLTIPETAVALNLSEATVKREWVSARAWLHQHISGL